MAALRELASRTRMIFKIDCRFQCAKAVQVEDNNTATHLYRIAQEAVTNAIKHGQAAHIRIGLRSSPAQMVLAVTDDGIGIDHAARPQTGMGLRIMDYRARMIGGTLAVSRKTKGGTEVICAIKPPAHPLLQKK
jgi:two-component system CheB/CheR fusion protein